ncbi:hypothetical protein [Methylopila sp. M107]|uniref:hypothetical protein n=1 Tax=Methylopila sp. M107 TaxID=1101190 RepID=UPI0003689276|nr:hypothetical protein [Methylopila sp. M107]
MSATPSATADSPQVAAQISEMRASWNRRLGVNLFAIVAISAYFAYPTWGRPEFGATVLSILPTAIGVALLMLVVNRWFVARQTRQIRDAAAGGRRG